MSSAVAPEGAGHRRADGLHQEPGAGLREPGPDLRGSGELRASRGPPGAAPERGGADQRSDGQNSGLRQPGQDTPRTAELPAGCDVPAGR